MKNLKSLLTPKTTGARLIVALIAICVIAVAVASVFTPTAHMQEQRSKETIAVEAAATSETASEASSEKEEQPTRSLIGDAVRELKNSNNVPERDVLLAGLTGTKNIPGDYATLALAITDLNTNGVGTGGVTFNVITGNPQTAPAGGYIIGGTGSLVLTSSSAANPIVFTGNGNTITAFNPQTVGNINDGIIKLVGADFVTIQGFTLQENPANAVIATAATNNATEFGIGLFYVTTTDGAQNNTIQNNTITMNRAYANTFCIFSTTRASSTAVGTTADATTQAGTNSNTHVYTNNLSNANYAIVFLGSSVSSPQETGTDIGGASAATGNTITNTATGTAALSTYITLTGSNYAIFLNHQINDNVSFNSITTASVAGAVTVGGILKNYSVTNPTGTITTTINNNTVTATNNPTAATTGGIIGINNQGLTSFLSTATMSMNNNTVQNCVLGGSTSTTNGITAMTNLSLPGTMNMTGNTIVNNAITATTSTTGILAGISNSGAAGTVNINSNVVRSMASTSASGQMQGLVNSGAVVTALNFNNNQLGNATSGYFSSSVASSGTLFGIVTSGGATTATLTIQNNDIRGITYNVAASAAQAYIQNTAASPNTNISSNTFTNLTVNTTGSVTFISNSVTHAAGTTHNVNSNSIVTGFNKTGAGGTIAFYNAFGSSPATVTEINNGNNFSNLTFTGATAIIGWRSADGTTPGSRKTITNNTFSNITTGAGAISSILYVGFSDNTFANNNVSGNVIGNITGGAAVTGIFSDGGNQNFFDNRINTLTSNGAAAAVLAMQFTGATAQNIFRNKIYDIQSTDAAGTVNGIQMSAGTTFTVYNNLIGDLRTPAANAANPLIGINLTGGTTLNAYYNTVYLNGASTGALFGSSAISASTTPTVTLRNNIFVNNSTVMGAGLATAYRRSSATISTYGATSNNNDFFGSTIYTDGTNTFTTPATYKSFVAPRDAASFSENPTFLSTTGSSANFLHIDPTVATQLESGGAPVAGITDDFDAQTRNASTPDVGADEFTGIAADLTGPTITYTTLGNGAALASRSFANVTITDASGVNTTTGTRPRVYYKKGCDAANTFNDNTNATAGWKFAEANGTGGSPFTFTIDYSRLPACGGGSGAGVVAVGDTIQYFVVAQDLATTPNVGINSGTFAAQPSSVALTSAAFPVTGTINSYNIVASISGTKTVCASGCDYTTLTGAGGVFADLNGKIATASIEIQINGDLTAGEDGTNGLNSVAEDPTGSNFTVKIYPTGSARVITGTNAGALIRLNGADRVTLDGSIGGTGTDRSLTITNTNTGTSSAVVWMQSNGADGATGNTTRNLNVTGSGNTQTLVGIGSGSSTISITSTGTGNNSNTIQNNNISKTQYGIYSGGASAANKNTGTVITQNAINTASPNNVATGGILANFENGIQITQNDIGNILKHDGTTGTTGTAFGIALGIVPSNTVTTFTGSDVINAVVTRNKINALTQLNSTGYSAFGIVVNSVTSGTTLVANNMISGVRAASTASDFSAGIVAGGGTGSTTQLYFNSVSMTGSRNAATFPSYGLAIGSGDPVVDVRNNIFFNTQTSSSTGKMYAIGTGSTTFANLTSNFNDFFVSGTSAFVGQTGGLGTSGTDRATLLNWQTATTKDANSISANPQFASATDLHITRTAPGTPAPVENVGTPIGSVTNDFDNDTRDASTPDIGADEVMTVAYSAAAYSAGEADGMKTITVTRTSGAAASATVNYATANGTATGGAACGAGVDYANASGTLNFAAGETSKTFDITICEDSVYEANETVNLSLSTVTGDAILGSPDTAVLTINDNDTAPTLSVNDFTFTGVDSVVHTASGFTVTLTGATELPVTVHYATSDNTAQAGSDYTAASGTLTFNPGDTSMNIPITILPDNINEPTETFFIDLDTPMGATIFDGHGIGTIPNDDAAPTLSIDDVTHMEGNSGTTSYTFTVTKTGSTASNVTVDYATVNGSAIAPSDYTAIPTTTLTFLPAETMKQVTVQVNGDTVYELNENFTVQLSNASGATIADSDGVGTITNDESIGTHGGKIAFDSLRTGNGDIYVMNADGTNQARLTNDMASDSEPAFSPDGNKIAFRSNHGGDYEIYMMNADGTNQTNLTNNLAGDFNPAFSPDGKIVFTSDRDGNAEIYVMNADGTNPIRLTNNPADDHGPAVSPDGNKIAFTSFRDGNAEIYVMNADGTNPIRLTNSPGFDYDPAFSPDGNKIAFLSVRDPGGIYLMNADGTGQTNIPNNQGGAYDPTFSPDGSKIAFAALHNGNPGINAEIFVINPDGTELTNITNDPADDVQPSWAIGDVVLLSVSDVTAAEGDSGTTDFTFTVTKTGSTSQTVTVRVDTADGTATAPGDYTAITNQTLTFAPNETTKQVTVQVNGDTTYEANETFTVNLSNATNAIPIDPQGIGTVTDDDTAPTLSIDDVTMDEGNSGTTAFTFTVTRTGATAFNTTVDYATANGSATAPIDYTAISTATLTLLPAETSKQVTVQVKGDVTYEANETFTLMLSNPGNATITNATGNGTITNDDAPPTLAINNVTTNEGQSGPTNLVFTITKTGATAFNATVNFTTMDGTALAGADYTADSNSLTFLPNQTSKQITVVASGDSVIEGNETFFVNLSSPSGATLGNAQGIGTLDNDDGPTGRLVFTKFDFDGDSKTDIAVWDGTSGNWHVINSNGGAEAVQFDWGRSSLGDIAVPADYDGDGKTDYAVFRPSDGNWYIVQSQTGTPVIRNWGQSGDVPVPGDYDGDNRADVAVWRASEGNWYILNSRDNTVTLRNWGTVGDQPVLGDFDGDRMTDIAVYRPTEGNWYIINSSTGGVTLLNWGAGADRPAPGDYDGDGKTDITIFRAAGDWYIRKSTGGVMLRNWGNMSDKLVPADYDGDGKCDIAVYRPSEGNWYYINSHDNSGFNFFLGGGGEVPVPAAYLH